MRLDEDRLRDIVTAIDRIVSNVGEDRSSFDSDPRLQVWCLHHITIMGEAASRLSQELRGKYPSVPWRDIIGMRNAIVHGYFDVDWNEVWNVIARDLSSLKQHIEGILKLEGFEE